MRIPLLVLLALYGMGATAHGETLRLEVSSDGPCSLLLDSAPAGQVGPGTTRTLEAAAGERTVTCQSLEYPGAVATRTSLGSGKRTVAFTAAATWSRFTVDGSGWLHDSHSGLRWHRQASVEELDWVAAGAWCRSLGGRLPSSAELRALHVHGDDRTDCGEGLFCGIPHQFSLPSRFVWTGEEFEGDQAIINGLAGQKPSAQSVPKDQAGVRALCVAAAP